MKTRHVLAAGALALAPTTAWAHGDHEGLHGLIHVLTEPLHLGIMLLVGLGAVLLGKRIKAVLANRAARKARRD